MTFYLIVYLIWAESKVDGYLLVTKEERTIVKCWLWQLTKLKISYNNI